MGELVAVDKIARATRTYRHWPKVAIWSRAYVDVLRSSPVARDSRRKDYKSWVWILHGIHLEDVRPWFKVRSSIGTAITNRTNERFFGAVPERFARVCTSCGLCRQSARLAKDAAADESKHADVRGTVKNQFTGYPNATLLLHGRTAS